MYCYTCIFLYCDNEKKNTTTVGTITLKDTNFVEHVPKQMKYYLKPFLKFDL